MQGPTHQRRDIEPGFAFFCFLASLREQLHARARLPRYVERDHRGRLSFRVDQGARMPLPDDPETPEFRRAYNAALVDAIAAEDDTGDDCRELEAMHAAQRRARRGGR